MAKTRGFKWLGPTVEPTKIKTCWQCEHGHEWAATYNNILKGSGCGECLDYVNGVRVSKQQRQIADMLDGELNARACGVYIDIALRRKGLNIAVEYDGWFWHAHQTGRDEQRDTVLLENDWRILHIKSNSLLPSKNQLDNAISEICAGGRMFEIVLEDWGVGPTRFELTTHSGHSASSRA